MIRLIRRLLDNEWFVAFVGGILVTIAAAYIVAFSGLGPTVAPAALPRRSSPQPINEMISAFELAPSVRTNLAIWVQNATPDQGVNIDIYNPSGEDRGGSFVRADSAGQVTWTVPWPWGGGRPEAGLWHFITHDDSTGSEASAFLWIT